MVFLLLQCQDLTPITDKHWQRFYIAEFGRNSWNDSIKMMKDLNVTYKWRDLYNVRVFASDNIETVFD